jgi:hypothetical protein
MTLPLIQKVKNYADRIINFLPFRNCFPYIRSGVCKLGILEMVQIHSKN